MRNIFRNDRNQVRWGYKLASFLLIQEILGPIAIILVSVALVNLLFPILQASGVLDGDGVLRMEYAEVFENSWFIAGMVIQNLLLSLFFLGAWISVFSVVLFSAKRFKAFGKVNALFCCNFCLYDV